VTKRRFKDNSGKRRGPYSLERDSRRLVPPTAPPAHPKRDRMTRIIRAAAEDALPALRVTGPEFEDGEMEMITWATLQVAAELIALGDNEVRKAALERAVQYLRNAVAVEVREYHQRTVNRTERPAPVYHKRPLLTFQVEQSQLTDHNKLLEEMQPIFERYRDGFLDAIDRLHVPDDPKGSVLMMIYAMQETVARVVSGGPDEFTGILVPQLIDLLQTRVTTLKERRRESDVADGQLQADPLEAVPAGDDERVQLPRSEERQEP
jgi:hypothetical protein